MNTQRPMLYNYLKIILRSTIHDGMYNFIIVVGLAIGIAASLIIAQYIHFELSFDRDFQNDQRVFMSYMRFHVKNEDTMFDIECHGAITPAFETVPEVEHAARMVPVSFAFGHEWGISKESGDVTEESFVRSDHLFYADASLLDIFSIKLIEGNRRTALRNGYTVVLSKQLADKLFPAGDGMGKTLRLQSLSYMKQFEVVGIAEKRPANATLQFNALFSMKSFGIAGTDEEWSNPVFRTYIKIRPDASREVVEKKINRACRSKLLKQEEFNGIAQTIRLLPYADIHFFTPYVNGVDGAIRFSGDERLLFYFGILAVLILLISWANYVNLTTARSLRRAKEVGLRKVNGARPGDLVKQFLLEYLFMNVISMMLAFTIAQLFFDVFTNAIGSKASWIFWTEPGFWFAIVVFMIISTLASGLYPAFVLSAYNPIKVLKGTFTSSQTGSAVRKSLVLVQFTLSVLLLISIYVISSQIFFMQHKDLGQSVDKVVVINAMEIDTTLNRTDAYLRWKMRMNDNRYVKSTTATGFYPGQSEMMFQFYRRPSETQQRIGLQTHYVSEGYLKTLDINLLYGRDFDDEKPDELNRIIISKKSALNLGFTNLKDVIGQTLRDAGSDQVFEVIGITDDFTSSLKMPLFTHAFRYKYFITGQDHFNYYMVKTDGSESQAIENLKREWSAAFPETPFDYFFLSDFFHTLYKDEYQFAGVFGFFSFVGVAITCMGLYGLSLYSTSIRQKEVGIRKSLGGSVSSIMWLFSKDYLKIIVVASVIAVPIGLWQLNAWLDTYPNRIALSFDMAIIPVIAALAIAIITVSYHTYRAASTNPVTSLRSE